MKEYITESQFINRFEQMGRETHFSYEGRKALFEYFEQLEEDIGETLDFDCIAICCEYTQYDSIKVFWTDYGKECYPDIEAIEQETTVIMIDDKSFIIKQF